MIRNRSPLVCMYAIKLNYNMFKYIENPTFSMCLIALKENPSLYTYLDNDMIDQFKQLGVTFGDYYTRDKYRIKKYRRKIDQLYTLYYSIN